MTIKETLRKNFAEEESEFSYDSLGIITKVCISNAMEEYANIKVEEKKKALEETLRDLYDTLAHGQSLTTNQHENIQALLGWNK